MSVQLTEDSHIWQLWDSAPLAVVVVDDNGRIQYTNPEANEIFDYEPAELLGKELQVLLPQSVEGLHEAHVEQFFKAPHTRAMGKLKHLQARRKDGTLFPVEIGLSFVTVNQTMMAISLIKDISASKQLELYAQQLSQQNADLEAFAHIVAHDLKSPLSQIVGFAEILKITAAELTPEELNTYLDMIYQIGHRSIGIIDDILLMASLQQQNIPNHVLDMAQIVTDVLASVQATTHHAQIQTGKLEDWPIAFGYAPWVARVWANYITNALKYGGANVQIELDADPAANGQVCFWVKDNGPGIPLEKQADLFSEYTRGDGQKAMGHGLGLSIVQHIIQKLGGEVGVSSVVGEGSQFYFTLPVAPTSSDDADNPQTPPLIQ